ncbi:hypothetical protein OH807_24945 [Kitasatospora sp. NBC_01560]|uniref:hypothetical protein n=1 Tax=Kitasatospora sp. NBC_01560 TaxID=2975965 RepID=UPI0038652A46
MIKLFGAPFAAVAVTALYAGTGAATDPTRALLLPLAGYALSDLLAQVWVLLTARLQSKRVHLVVLGSGRILAEARIGTALVQLRAFPGTLNVYWLLARAPLARLRIWLGTAVAAGLQTALGVWLLTGGTAARPLGVGVLTATAWRILATLRGPLGTGRILLLMPFRPAGLPFGSGPNVRAGIAFAQGRLTEFGAAVAELTPEDNPEQDRGELALAEGRYAEAEEHGRRARAQALTVSHAIEAGMLISSAIVGAADAGELPPDRYLPRLMTVLGEFGGPRKALERTIPALADLARLDNRPDEALAIARSQRALHAYRPWRAESDCSLAAALGALGRFDEAREALARARRTYPGLARTDLVERQLDRWAGDAPVAAGPVSGGAARRPGSGAR